MEKVERRGAPTIEELAEDYLTKHAKAKKSSWRADEWKLNKDVLPAWRHRLVRDIKRADVVALLDEIADPKGRNAPQSAVHVRRLLSKMFNFALSREYGIEYNPVQGTAGGDESVKTASLGLSCSSRTFSFTRKSSRSRSRRWRKSAGGTNGVLNGNGNYPVHKPSSAAKDSPYCRPFSFRLK